MPSIPRIRHSWRKTNVDCSDARLGNNRSGFVGDSAGLHHDPHQIVRHQHQRVHHTSQMQRLERPNIRRRHSDHRPRVLHSEQRPLLPLHPLDYAVRLHHLHGIRVRPRPDSDPVPPDHHTARSAHRRRPVRRRRDVQRRRDIRSAAERSGVEAGGEQKEEDQAGEAEAKDETDEAAESVDYQPENRRRRLDRGVA